MNRLIQPPTPSRDSTPPPTPTPTTFPTNQIRDGRTVHIFYGSATGNSEFIAKRIHADCQAK